MVSSSAMGQDVRIVAVPGSKMGLIAAVSTCAAYLVGFFVGKKFTSFKKNQKIRELEAWNKELFDQIHVLRQKGD